MKTKLSLVLSALLMTGCLDVKDNDANQELADAVKAQNEILKEQNNPSLTLIGSLENLSTDGTLAGARVELRVGSEVYSASTINTNGSFEIEKLPLNTDYQLHVTSTEGSFLNAIIYGTTRGVVAGGITQNIGTVYVSKGVEKEFSVVDSETKANIAGLTFYSYTHTVRNDRTGDVNGYLAQSYVSTYDEDTGKYTITVPNDAYNTIRVSFDLDGDKSDDFSPVSNEFSQKTNPNLSYSYTISNLNLLEKEVILLEKANLNADQTLQIRVSLIDNTAAPLLDAPLHAVNDDEQSFAFVYNEDTNQYIADVKYTNAIEILMPSFNQGETHFESNQARVSRSNDSLHINTDGFDRIGNLQYESYNLDLDESVIDIVLAIREIEPQTPIEVVSAFPVNEASHAYNIFYSQPIALIDGKISVIQKDVLNVTFGNDSDNDFWSNGTTLIEQKSFKKPVDSLLTLNGTKLTLTPKSPLEKGYTYEYEIGEITDINNEVDADIANDDSNSFEVELDTPSTFDINSLVLDNNNFMNNGTPIVTANTAGSAVVNDDRSNSAYMILPKQLEDIFENFSLKKLSYTRNNVITNDVDSYTIVSKGNVSSIGHIRLLKLAQNEDVVYDNVSSGRFWHGTTLDDGQYAVLNLGYSYLSDNVSGNENSMTFEYNYELKSGEVKSGTIKLLVQ